MAILLDASHCCLCTECKPVYINPYEETEIILEFRFSKTRHYIRHCAMHRLIVANEHRSNNDTL